MRGVNHWSGGSEIEVEAVQVGRGQIAVACIAKQTAVGRIRVVDSVEFRSVLAAHGLGSWLQESGLSLGDIEQVRLMGGQEVVELSAVQNSPVGLRLGKPVVLEHFPALIHFLPSSGRLRVPLGNAIKASHRAEKIRVLIVDDSETIRKLLKKIISSDPALECVGTIDHPTKVEGAIRELKPHVLTLDIHMPVKTGTQLVQELFPKYRLPMVMISSLSMEDGTDVLNALEAGAVDYIQKPSAQDMSVVAPMICEKVRNAASSKTQISRARARKSVEMIDPSLIDRSTLIAIGSSTGGTEALKTVLTALPERIPPIVIVQHIPAVFSKAFADRMNQICKFKVKEAVDGELVEPGKVLVAPGGFQMKVKLVGNDLKVIVDDSPAVNRHKPSVDFLFNSIAALKRPKIVAAILTGMGADGAKGLLALKNGGAKTLAQDEATCVVYGMPREAALLGAAERIVALDDVAATLMEMSRMRESTRKVS